MRHVIHRIALLALLALTSAGAARAQGVSYPDTEPGRHAREYFPAYNGDEAAMRAYFAAHVSAAALEKRSLDARVDVWREIRGHHGALTPQKVLGSGPDFVTMLVTTANSERLSFRFNCEPEAPHGLVGLQIEQMENGAGAPEPEPAGPPPTDSQIVAAFSGELDSLSRVDRFAGAALLDKGGVTLFGRAYGMASREAKAPNTLDTRFNLGSINKIFTTAAIFQLVEQGKLKLDDTIEKYLKDYPAEAARKITIQMLLDHRAGVGDVLQNDALWKNPAKVRTASDWYALIKDQPLQFEPGAKQQYSNGGFCMLGMIVERVSGEDYYAYVTKHIYTPAGMTRTDSYVLEQRKDNFAMGYSREGGGMHAPGTPPSNEPLARPWLPAPHDLGRGSAAGGGYSTVGDMVKFGKALRAHTLLDAAHSEMLLGRGIAGGSPGCNAMFQCAGPYTLVVLSNLDPPAAERFARTTGRMVRRASGETGGGEQAGVRAGGGSH